MTGWENLAATKLLASLLFWHRWYEPGSSDTFYLPFGTGGEDEGDLYLRVLDVLMKRTNDSRYTNMEFKRLCDHPVLQEQRLSQKPPLVSQRTELALRCDNLYLSGFSNAAGQWFRFKKGGYRIPGSIQLNFKSNYASLMGNGDEDDDGPSLLGVVKHGKS